MGDVKGGSQFTYLSLDDFRIIRDQLFGDKKRDIGDRDPVQYAVFIDPPLAHIGIYNPQIQISAESETKRSIFREKDKTKRSKKESAQHSKSRNKSFVMTSVSAL